MQPLKQCFSVLEYLQFDCKLFYTKNRHFSQMNMKITNVFTADYVLFCSYGMVRESLFYLFHSTSQVSLIHVDWEKRIWFPDLPTNKGLCFDLEPFSDSLSNFEIEEALFSIPILLSECFVSSRKHAYNMFAFSRILY